MSKVEVAYIFIVALVFFGSINLPLVSSDFLSFDKNARNITAVGKGEEDNTYLASIFDGSEGDGVIVDGNETVGEVTQRDEAVGEIVDGFENIDDFINQQSSISLPSAASDEIDTIAHKGMKPGGESEGEDEGEDEGADEGADEGEDEGEDEVEDALVGEANLQDVQFFQDVDVILAEAANFGLVENRNLEDDIKGAESAVKQLEAIETGDNGNPIVETANGNSNEDNVDVKNDKTNNMIESMMDSNHTENVVPQPQESEDESVQHSDIKDKAFSEKHKDTNDDQAIKNKIDKMTSVMLKRLHTHAMQAINDMEKIMKEIYIQYPGMDFRRKTTKAEEKFILSSLETMLKEANDNLMLMREISRGMRHRNNTAVLIFEALSNILLMNPLNDVYQECFKGRKSVKADSEQRRD